MTSDNYSISLDLEPQVIDFLGYDTSFNTNMIIEGQEVESKAGMMPILSERSIKTKVVIWDGETVVLGGLIQERLEKYEDRIPLLGDIPFLGRLFTNKGEKSTKVNVDLSPAWSTRPASPSHQRPAVSRTSAINPGLGNNVSAQRHCQGLKRLADINQAATQPQASVSCLLLEIPS